MDSKLPSSSAPESADDDFPRGVRLKLNPVEWVFVIATGGFITAMAFALFSVLYVIARFFWALASG